MKIVLFLLLAASCCDTDDHAPEDTAQDTATCVTPDEFDITRIGTWKTLVTPLRPSCPDEYPTDFVAVEGPFEGDTWLAWLADQNLNEHDCLADADPERRRWILWTCSVSIKWNLDIVDAPRKNGSYWSRVALIRPEGHGGGPDGVGVSALVVEAEVGVAIEEAFLAPVCRDRDIPLEPVCP